MYLEYDDIRTMKNIKEIEYVYKNNNFWEEKCKVEKVVSEKEESKWKTIYKHKYDEEKKKIFDDDVIKSGYKREIRKRLREQKIIANEYILEKAINKRKINIVNEILNNMNIGEINSEYLERVLFILIEYKTIEMSKKIIKYIKYEKERNYNPFLCYAAKTGDIELFDLIKEKFCNVDNYIYSIELAVENNKYKMVRYIAEKYYYPSNEEINSLMYVCGKYGFVNISEYLVKLGGDINILYKSSLQYNQLSTLILVQKMGIKIYSNDLYNSDLRIINYFNSIGYKIPYDSFIFSICSSSNIFIYDCYVDDISSNTLLYVGFKTKNLKYIEKAFNAGADNISKIISNFLDVSYFDIFTHLLYNSFIHINDIFFPIIKYILCTNLSLDFNIVSFFLNYNPSNLSLYLYYVCSTYNISSIISFLLANSDPYIILSHCIELNILPDKYLFSAFIQKGIDPTYLIYLIIISYNIKYKYISKYSHYGFNFNLLFNACSSSTNISSPILNYIKSNVLN